MEAISKLPGVKTVDLIKANNVRLFLRVITISDMATLDGKAIDMECFTGHWQANSSLN
jgi:hypothetical protein